MEAYLDAWLKVCQVPPFVLNCRIRFGMMSCWQNVALCPYRTWQVSFFFTIVILGLRSTLSLEKCVDPPWHHCVKVRRSCEAWVCVGEIASTKKKVQSSALRKKKKFSPSGEFFPLPQHYTLFLLSIQCISQLFFLHEISVDFFFFFNSVLAQWRNKESGKPLLIQIWWVNDSNEIKVSRLCTCGLRISGSGETQQPGSY